jgi:hypothetical protein
MSHRGGHGLYIAAGEGVSTGAGGVGMAMETVGHISRDA